VQLDLFQPTPVSLRTLQDLSLASQVRAALLHTPGLNTLDIQVRAEGGAVFLEGAVFGPHWAELATQTAKTVRGVDTVTCQTSEDPLLYTPLPRV
jgi:osmotically-inducible protein OsmY